MTTLNTTFDPHWFVAAQELADTMLAHFADREGMFHDTSAVREGYRPFRIASLGAPTTQATAISLLQDPRLVADRGPPQAVAYVCDAPVPGRAFACQASIIEPQGLQVQLGQRCSCRASPSPSSTRNCSG